jgi:PRC-barrel domain
LSVVNATGPALSRLRLSIKTTGMKGHEAVPTFGASVRGFLCGRRRDKEVAVLVALVLLAAQQPTIAASRNSQPLAGPLSWRLAQAASSSQPAAAPPAPRPAAQPASATPAPQNEENTKEEKTSVPATVVDGEQLESVLGIEAFSSAGDDMGRIVDILVDRTGQIRAAIIDFGGFLGVGSRKIAVDWRSLHFDPKKAGAVVVNLTKDQLRVAPVYKAAEPVVMVGGPGAKP